MSNLGRECYLPWQPLFIRSQQTLVSSGSSEPTSLTQNRPENSPGLKDLTKGKEYDVINFLGPAVERE